MADNSTTTPEKGRKVRPSFSLVESRVRRQNSPERHSYLSRFSGSSIKAVNFGFSFLGPGYPFSQANIPKKEEKAFYKYLAENYDANAVDFQGPFMSLECGEKMPPAEQRPFTIAGLTTFWQSSQERIPFISAIGDMGLSEDIKADPSVVAKMEQHIFPSDDVIVYLANYIFPDCIGISVLDSFMVVELPRTSPQEFGQRLRTSPGGIEGAPYRLLFYNGQLPNTRKSRMIAPHDERLDDLVADDTDYVEQDGQFYPGSMLSSLSDNGEIYGSVTAGILVEKRNKRRLICSWHNWEEHDNAHPGLLGKCNKEARKVFALAQGSTSDEEDHKSGTTVGFVQERVQETDIALAQINDGIRFSNKFMDINTSAKTFVHSRDQKAGDIYIIDSFATGAQKLYGLGRRAKIERARRDSAHSPFYAHSGRHLLPNDKVAHIHGKQGVYATNAPIIPTTPQIRDSACGSVLVRCRSMAEHGISESDMLKRGEMCAILHCTDLQPKHNQDFAGNFLIYADAFDPLIEDGWSVVQETETETSTELPKPKNSQAKKRRRAR